MKCSPNGDVEEPHLCLGVCGEECLEICKVCTPEKYEEAKEVFFGTEEEEDARFIQLKDCKHYVEVKVSIKLISLKEKCLCACGSL